MPLSGALDGLPNDVVLPGELRAEVKVRATGLSRVYKALEVHDVVWYRSEEDEDLYAMTLAAFQLFLGGKADRLLVGDIRPDTGLRQVRSWIAAENADVLAFKADRKGWLVFVPASVWNRLHGAVEPAVAHA